MNQLIMYIIIPLGKVIVQARERLVDGVTGAGVCLNSKSLNKIKNNQQ